MKKYLSLVIILPLLVVSQTDFCGERPIKPTQLDNQSKKEYKQSTVFLNYKKILKEWKECMSPLAVSKRDEERLEQERQAREMQIVEEQLVNPCGEKPEKPKRMKGLSIDEYRETTEFKNYRERLKDWKKCMSPQNLTEPIFNKSNNTEINPKNICGEKPEKPIREDGLNHEEYKQTSAYQEYREKIKTWKECIDRVKNPIGPCGEKPEKPIREDGLNHEEYKQTSAYQEYREKIKTWKECLDENE